MDGHGVDNSTPLERARRYKKSGETEYSQWSEEDLRESLYRANDLLERHTMELVTLRQQALQEKQRAAKAEKQLLTQQDLYARQTERAEKFKAAFSNLKASPDVRIARSLTAPARRMRRLMVRRSKSDPSPQEESKFPAHAGPAEMKEETPLDPLGLSIVTAKEEFHRRGMILNPWRRIESRKPELSAKDAVFYCKLAGAVRLLESLPALPPQQPSPAYFPKRGRVLYCTHSTGEFSANGYSTRTTGLTRALAEGSDLVVVARPGYPWDVPSAEQPSSTERFETEYEGVKYVYNPGPSLLTDPVDLYFLRAADIIAREATIYRAEIIHAASNHLNALPALIAARRLGLPFVYEVRGLWEITESTRNESWGTSERFALSVALETLVANGADQVLAITSQVRDEMIRRGVSGHIIDVLPNAADPYEFAPVPPEREFLKEVGGTEVGCIVGYAGSLLDYEGLDLLIRAFATVREPHPESTLLVVGNGPELEGLQDLAGRLGISDAVVFTGLVPAKDVPRYLSVMDIVVCPRISNAVTEMVSPLKPLEAMAAGKALVVSNVAPMLELIGTDGVRGMTFAAGDFDALAQVLVELLNDSERRGNLGRSARSWMRKHRNWSDVAESVRESHRRAADLSAAQAFGARDLKDMNIMLIADEFTRSSIEPECRLILPSPSTWRRQLNELQIDVLLVESAWEGNSGTWRRKVGFYDEDSFTDLKELVSLCRRRGIPTIFWNKEDPIHYERFKRTAALFDSVLTTDAEKIPEYFLQTLGSTNNISSLPFWAQPRLHNPLPGNREFEKSVAYAGTFYGTRYAERSRVLADLLGAVAEQGLVIYDRQANIPDSPYDFPESLADHLRGGLTYSETVEAYKAHPIHLNVNSVTESSTMFSRRAVELAAIGTPVISGPGRGIEIMFNGLIPTIDNADDAAMLVAYWLEREPERNSDAWDLHRYAFRAHLAGSRLTYALRTAGLIVNAPALGGYRLTVEHLDDSTCNAILEQTHRPEYVIVSNKLHAGDSPAARALIAANVAVFSEMDAPLSSLYSCNLGEAIFDKTAAEDLCRAADFSHGPVQMDSRSIEKPGKTLWEIAVLVPGAPRLTRPGQGERSNSALSLRRRYRLAEDHAPVLGDRVRVVHESRKVLIAGHDLKFASGIMGWLKKEGHEVRVDEWDSQSHHDVIRSRDLLRRADSIFCEWSLANLEWYARHRTAQQRLTSRFHSQELFTSRLRDLDMGLIDHTVFVGEFIRQAAIRRFGYVPSSTSVIPNALGFSVTEGAVNAERRFTLGLVGFVPRQKHLDRALDLLASLRAEDERFRIRIKGKMPEEYAWMASRQSELKYYQSLKLRIRSEPLLSGAVTLDAYGNDMAEWYSKIGVALSVSDFESFHMTLADGAASGATPQSLNWPGAELIYPDSWLHDDVDSIRRTVLEFANNPQNYLHAASTAQAYVAEKFAAEKVLPKLGRVILGGN